MLPLVFLMVVMAWGDGTTTVRQVGPITAAHCQALASRAQLRHAVHGRSGTMTAYCVGASQ